MGFRDQSGKQPPSKPSQPVAGQIMWRLDEWFPDLGSNKLKVFKTYFDVLVKLNKTVNLVSAKTIPMADAIHFADSILGAKLVLANHKIDTLYDVGGAGGFPGIVFAILDPSIKVHLLERDKKKVDCLKEIVASCNLQNCFVNGNSIESLSDGSVSFAVCRGVGNISKTMLVVRKIFKPGGILFHFKGEEWTSEVAEIPTQLCSHWAPHLIGEYKLPIGSMRFAVVGTEKLSG